VGGTFFAVSAGFLVLCLAVTVAVASGRPSGPHGLPSFGGLGDTAVALLVAAALIPALTLAARAWQGRPAGTLASVCGRLRWSWLAACLPVAAATQLVYLGAEPTLELTTTDAVAADVGLAGWVGWGAVAVAAPVLLALVPLQAAAEEFLFRGWLLQALGGPGRSPVIAIAVPAGLFALVHGLGTVWGFVDLVGFAVIAGWLTVRTGGLEAAIALHLTTNLLEMSWQAATGELATTATAADNSWLMTVADLTMVALYAVVISRLARRRRIAVVVPEPAGGAVTARAPVPAAIG
jgi:membrane protease YdiL (CAAX protease family)